MSIFGIEFGAGTEQFARPDDGVEGDVCPFRELEGLRFGFLPPVPPGFGGTVQLSPFDGS